MPSGAVHPWVCCMLEARHPLSFWSTYLTNPLPPCPSFVRVLRSVGARMDLSLVDWYLPIIAAVIYLLCKCSMFDRCMRKIGIEQSGDPVNGNRDHDNIIRDGILVVKKGRVGTATTTGWSLVWSSCVETSAVALPVPRWQPIVRMPTLSPSLPRLSPLLTISLRHSSLILPCSVPSVLAVVVTAPARRTARSRTHWRAIGCRR